MTAPFAAAAPALWANGYSAIPLYHRSKKPHFQAGSNWAQVYCNRLATEAERDTWLAYPDANVGICLGPASGIMALDFDNDVNGMQARIIDMIPDSPVKKRGAKGFTAMYRFSGEASKGLSVDGVRVLDVLASGKQTVLPPSLHPDNGRPYEWITPATLEDTPPEALPTIPADVYREVLALFAPKYITPAWQQRPIPTPARGEGDDELWSALAFIPPDDYDMWIQVGMALKQEMGQRGFTLWDRWSARSGKYDSRVMPGKWASFNRADITVGTVYHLAKVHGYVSPPPEEPRPRAVFVLPGDELPAVRPPQPAATAISPEILNAPGLVGRTMRWILETSIYPIPLLALAASIGAVGVAMGHKVQSPTRLRTNFYTLGIAASGAGKDHARKAVASLFATANMRPYIAGSPASGAGLLTGLRENSGKAIIFWDEIGRVLSNLNSRQAGTHQRDISNYIMEIFSTADSEYAGVQYANHDGKMKRTPIDQPCLCIYGTTVPERFYQGLSGEDALDGFLARFLIFESLEYQLHPRKNVEDISLPPDALVAEYAAWRDAPSNHSPMGNMDGVLRIAPRVVPYTPEAEDLISAYMEAMRLKAYEESVARTGLSPMYARAAEHAIKLALVAHEGDAIGEEAMRWGIAVAGDCVNRMVEAIRQNVSSNEYEKTQKRVLKVIVERGGEWIGHSELIRSTREIAPRTRTEVLQNLVDGAMIEMRQEDPGKNGKPVRFYRAG